MIASFCNLPGGAGSSSWGISSIFGSNSSDNHSPVKENSSKKSFGEPLHSVEQSFSMIHLREVSRNTIIKSNDFYLSALLDLTWLTRFVLF